MKATKNFRHWAHVSCALWIPETSFGNADKMEPIMNLNQIALARWQLVCSLCKEKRGCCLQCSERRCHAAFHVTCGFKYGLEMKTLIVGDGDGSGDGSDAELTACAPSGSMLASSASGQVVFRAYCQKHTKKRAQMQQEGLLEDEEEEEEEEDEDEDEDEEDEEDDEDEDTQSDEVKSETTDQDKEQKEVKLKSYAKLIFKTLKNLCVSL